MIADEGSVEVRLVCAADTVMAEGLMTWLDRVEMVPSVVMGVTREALELSTVPPAKLVDTVPVTVPRVVTPKNKKGIEKYAQNLKNFQINLKKHHSNSCSYQ